ncbi:MAG: hypothetical protein KGO02_02175 [Alphaproteobacteria bacterium]|nr:hypothetical protein [Alphaproteobacteria bacterium]
MDEKIEAVLTEQPPGKALLRALKTFLLCDSYLLEVDANERSITFLIARYLAVELPEFHVDCEYNRDGVDPKKLGYFNLHPDEEDADARTVFPDIIAHHRGTDDNYLVIEVKKATNPVTRDVDFAKLAGYKRELGYRYSVFVELTAAPEAGVSRVEWV